MKIINISKDLFSAPREPMEIEPRRQTLASLEAGDACNETAIYTSLHTGTHLYAPSFVFDEYRPDTVSDLKPEQYIGAVTVVTVPEGPITGEVVENYFPRNAKKVIVRSYYANDPVTFFGGAADDLGALGYDLIGFEGLADNGTGNVSLYRDLMNRGSLILEGLDLQKVERDGEYFLMAAPLLVEGAESAPVRALLVEDQLLWTSKESRLRL